MKTALPRTALVSGANRGIGLAIAESLAKEHGINVLLGSRDLAAGQAAAGKLSGNVVPVKLDLSTEAELHSDLAVIQAAYPTIDILVNNAGVYPAGTAVEVTATEVAEAFQVNALAPWTLIRELSRGMIKRRYGRIVNVSSGGGSFEEGLAPSHAAYGASKAAMNALTLQLAQTLPRNVKANAMCPGWVRTRMGGLAAPRSAAQGADTAVWLATLPDDGPTGGFFRDRRLIEW
jgi:NAD(P)-dependent dehydrogenase (short-subunit alcohol dehydrogenase family)